MEFQTLLETRRSVRSYLPGGKPDAETIKKLIAARAGSAVLEKYGDRPLSLCSLR